MRRDLGPKEALPNWLSVRNGSLELACSSSSLESDFSSNTLSIRNGLGPPSRYHLALFRPRAVGFREFMPSAKSSRLGCWSCSCWPWNALSFKLFGRSGSPFAAWQHGARVDFGDDGGRCESGSSVDLARAGNSHVPRRLSCAVVVRLRPNRSLAFSRLPFILTLG